MYLSGWQLHKGQQAFLEAHAPIRVLACGRRWGKTEVLAVDALHTLLADVPRTVLMVAPSVEQAQLALERVLSLMEANGWHP